MRISDIDCDAADTERVAAGAFSSRLQRAPVAVRAAVCCVVLHVVALVLLPWLAHSFAKAYMPRQAGLHRGRIVGWARFAVSWVGYTITPVPLIHRFRGAYVEFDPPRRFVDSGPYRGCRNPIVICVLGLVLCAANVFFSIGTFFFSLIGLLLAPTQVVWLEEPQLARPFGQPYRELLKRVPRCFPRRPRGDHS